jgi:signal transduction histidine kinase
MCSRLIIVFLVSAFLAAFQGHAQPVLIDSLEKVVALHRGDTTEVRALGNLISEVMRRDLQQAKQYCWMEKSLAGRLHDEVGLANACSYLMTIHLNTGRSDSSFIYVKTLEQMAKSTTNRIVSATYTTAAGLFYRNTGRPKEALPFMLEALKTMGTDPDKTRRAGQMLNVGNTYQAMGDNENASKYYIQSLALFEEVGNKRGQSFCMQGLGNTYKDLKQFDLGEKYYLASEKLKKELDDKRGLISTWMSLGAMYQDMNLYDRSMRYAQKGLALSRELKNDDQVMKFLFNIASLNLSMKKPDEARKFYQESLKIAQHSADTAFITRIVTDLIMLDTDKKVREDERDLLRHVEVAMEAGDRGLTAEGRQKLADWYSSRGQYDKAYTQIQLAHGLIDSIRGAEIQMQIKKMEEEYLGEKKDKEIALLRKDQELRSVELSRQNTMITAVLIALVSVVVIGLLLVNRYRVLNNARRALEIERVRNNIARDLHDEMGSALSSINILSKVAMVEGEPVARQYLQNIGDQSEKMMENMGDMVWSINPRNDSIEKIIVRMREFATEILDAKNIDYSFSENLPPGIELGTDKRKNLFMIFKEAVNNAAKYSNATRMDIGLAADNGSLVLSVKDNGKGFCETVEQSGNGLRNMRERANESGGSLVITSSPGEGTNVLLRIAIA